MTAEMDHRRAIPQQCLLEVFDPNRPRGAEVEAIAMGAFSQAPVDDSGFLVELETHRLERIRRQEQDHRLGFALRGDACTISTTSPIAHLSRHVAPDVDLSQGPSPDR